MAHSITIWKKNVSFSWSEIIQKKDGKKKLHLTFFLLNSLSKVDVSIICTVDFENDML